MSCRGHLSKLVACLLLPLLALTLVGPLPAQAIEPPPELNFVCIDGQDDVIYVAGPQACTGRETLRRLPEDRPLFWCADHLGRLTEVANANACSKREQPVRIPADGPVPVCARNIQGGRTLDRGDLRMVTDLSECERDETGLVTPAAPEAVADTYTVDEDSTLVVPDRGVLDNDRDLTGEPLTAQLESGPSEGVLQLGAHGGFTYDPRGLFDHLDEGSSTQITFSYRSDDGALRSAPATVTITITGRNDRPGASDDVIRVDEDTALQLNAPGLLGNDTDAENHPLTAELLEGPDQGTLDLRADGGLRFDPRQDFQHLGATEGEIGSTGFRYVARDGSTASDAATVRVEVRGINDAPVGGSDTVATDENTPVDIPASQLLSNDSDAEQQPLTVTDIVPPDPGNGAITPLPGGGFRYDPTADSTDADSAPDFDHLLRGQTAEVTLTYRADDGDLRSEPVTVTITVHGLSAPTANDDHGATDEDHEVAIDVLGNDQVEEGELTVQTEGTGGQVTLEDGTVARYDPRGAYDWLGEGESSADSFRYTLTNDEGSSTGDVTITLTGVNDAPVATDDSYEIEGGTPLTVPASEDEGPCPCGLLANDDDVDTDTEDLTARLVSPPHKGRLTLASDGGFVFDPAGEFDSTDNETSFTYRVDDGTDESAVATVELSVTSNTAPEFEQSSYDFGRLVGEQAPGSQIGVVAADDADGDDLAFAIVDPGIESFTIDDSGTVRVGQTPPAMGAHEFEIEVTDGRGGRDVATVKVVVVPELNAVDDAFAGVGNTQVVGGGDTVQTPYESRAAVRVGSLLANDGGETGTVVAVTDQPTALGGRVTIESDGAFVYQPPMLGANAWADAEQPMDSFTYTLDEAENVEDAEGLVEITLAEPVWYVDAGADAPGVGTAWAPYRSLSNVSGAEDADQPGQTVFLFGAVTDDPGTPVVEQTVHAGGVALENGQQLIGHAAGLTVGDIVVAAAGPRPRVDAPSDGVAIGLAVDNKVAGLDVGGAGRGIAGTQVGGLELQVEQITTGGDPLDLDTGELAVEIGRVSSTLGDAALRLAGTSGSVLIDEVDFDGAGNPANMGGDVEVSDNLAEVDIAAVALGSGGFTVERNAQDATVHVGTLTGVASSHGLDVKENRGTVTVDSADLTDMPETAVSIQDGDGTTQILGGVLHGEADGSLADLVEVISNDAEGPTVPDVTIGAEVRLDHAADGGGEATRRALAVSEIGPGGSVELTGRVIGGGDGLHAENVRGELRLLGGLDVQTVGVPAFTAKAVESLVVDGPGDATLVSDASTTLYLHDVGIGAGGARFSAVESTDADVDGLYLHNVDSEVDTPGLVISSGTVTSPTAGEPSEASGVRIAQSTNIDVTGLSIYSSSGAGVVVSGSTDVLLDGVLVDRPEGAGIVATATTDLVLDTVTVRHAGTNGIALHEPDGRQTIRGSRVESSRQVQLYVEDSVDSMDVEPEGGDDTGMDQRDEVLLESSVFSGGVPEFDSVVVRATDDDDTDDETDDDAAALLLRVAGDTPSGSIGGDVGLSAVASRGAALQLDLGTFAVAGTAGDGIRMDASGADTTLTFALHQLNPTGGGGIQMAGAAGIHAVGDGEATIGGTITDVDVVSPGERGIWLEQVGDVDIATLSVQGGDEHGIDIVDSESVTLDEVDVRLPRAHGLKVVRSSNVQVDDSRFEQRTPPPAGAGEAYPEYAAIWVRHLAGEENAITDTTLRGSIGHQLDLHNGACIVDADDPTECPPEGQTTSATVQISGITTVDTAVDPHPMPTDEVEPDPASAVHVLAGQGADLTVDLAGTATSHTDASVEMSAHSGGTLSVTGGHPIVHQGGGASLALAAGGTGSTLELALVGLGITQIAPGEEAAQPEHGLLVSAEADGEVVPLHDDADDVDPVCPPADRAMSIENSRVEAVGTAPAVTFLATGTEDPATESSATLEVDTSNLSATIEGGSGGSPAVEVKAQATATVKDSTLCGGTLHAKSGEGDAFLAHTVDGGASTQEDLRGLQLLRTELTSADGSGMVIDGPDEGPIEISDVLVRDVTVTDAEVHGMKFVALEDLVVRHSDVVKAGADALYVVRVQGVTLDGSDGSTTDGPGDKATLTSSGAHGVSVFYSNCLALTDYAVEGVGPDDAESPRVAAFRIWDSTLVDFRPEDTDPDDGVDHSDETVAQWLERMGNEKPAEADWVTGTTDPDACTGGGE